MQPIESEKKRLNLLTKSLTKSLTLFPVQDLVTGFLMEIGAGGVVRLIINVSLLLNMGINLVVVVVVVAVVVVDLVVDLVVGFVVGLVVAFVVGRRVGFFVVVL